MLHARCFKYKDSQKEKGTRLQFHDPGMGVADMVRVGVGMWRVTRAPRDGPIERRARRLAPAERFSTPHSQGSRGNWRRGNREIASSRVSPRCGKPGWGGREGKTVTAPLRRAQRRGQEGQAPRRGAPPSARPRPLREAPPPARLRPLRETPPCPARPRPPLHLLPGVPGKAQTRPHLRAPLSDSGVAAPLVGTPEVITPPRCQAAAP